MVKLTNAPETMSADSQDLYTEIQCESWASQLFHHNIHRDLVQRVTHEVLSNNHISHTYIKKLWTTLIHKVESAIVHNAWDYFQCTIASISFYVCLAILQVELGKVLHWCCKFGRARMKGKCFSP